MADSRRQHLHHSFLPISRTATSALETAPQLAPMAFPTSVLDFIEHCKL